MNNGSTDKEIISLVLQGDQQHYAELVKRYQNFVFSISLRYTQSREDAEEIAQDVFVKAYRSLSAFRADARFSTWLYTIATNCSLSFLRKKKLHNFSLDDQQIFNLANNRDSGLSANHLEQKSKLNMVNAAIGLLNMDDAKLVTLYYKGEQSLDEIGKLMGLDTNTIKVRLHRARGRLKQKMEEHFKQELKDMVN
ncbi:MAG: sigma-70 family RNA polymerase sigma factor [Ferruginibacter sp.]